MSEADKELIERLREDARGGFAYHDLSDQAADRLEALLAKIAELEDEVGGVTMAFEQYKLKRLREALEEIAKGQGRFGQPYD